MTEIIRVAEIANHFEISERTVFRDLADLEAGLEHILNSPADEGRVEMIVRRPETDQREVLDCAELDTIEGLVGDNWIMRGSSRTPDGSSHPDMQINLMNSRVIELISGAQENWVMAGDQFFVDLDLTPQNLPPGTRLTLGSAELEVTDIPHTGCAKFAQRFGLAAERFVNSASGLALNLRGINARVVTAGNVNVGDKVTKAG